MKLTKLALLALATLPRCVAAGACEAGTPNAILQNASPKNWVLLGVGPSDVYVTGSSTVSGIGASYIGLAEAGSLTTTGPSSIQTGVLLNMTGQVRRSGESLIGVITQDEDAAKYLGMAREDALSGSQCAASLASTTQMNAGNMTIAADQTVNVVNLTDLILINRTLTLSSHVQRDPPPTLILNISGEFQMRGNSKIVLEGTLDELHVVFNVIGPGQDVILSGDAGNEGQPSAEISGVLLAPLRAISVSSMQVNGTVIGGAGWIAITSGSQVTRHLQ